LLARYGEEGKSWAARRARGLEAGAQRGLTLESIRKKGTGAELRFSAGGRSSVGESENRNCMGMVSRMVMVRVA
jgi:hypothetical protein